MLLGGHSVFHHETVALRTRDEEVFPMSIIKYEFPEDLSEKQGYCVFPDMLENDALVVFHATPCKNQHAILCDGFRADPEKVSGLCSVSFVWKSSAALSHAMSKRATQPGDWCIFAVRCDSTSRLGLKAEGAVLYDYTLNPAPTIIGYCIVPRTYRFL